MGVAVKRYQVGDTGACRRCESPIVITARMARCSIYACARCQSSHRTPEYRAWDSMKKRCYNPNHDSYQWHGGRGIRVCERWVNDFAAFLADVGPRPSPAHTLDRFPDQNGNYEPGNVRWATWTEQQRNRRSNHLLTHDGRTQCLKAWAEEKGLTPDSLWKRINKGWSVAAALDTPPIPKAAKMVSGTRAKARR